MFLLTLGQFLVVLSVLPHLINPQHQIYFCIGISIIAKKRKNAEGELVNSRFFCLRQPVLNSFLLFFGCFWSENSKKELKILALARIILQKL